MHALASFRLWIPDTRVQARLVHEFDALQVTTRELVDSVHDNATRERHLRSAVLAAAFSGRLTGRSSDLDLVEEMALA